MRDVLDNVISGARKHMDSVKVHLTDDLRHVCLFVCLSVVSVRGVHPMGGRRAMLHRNLWEGKKLGSTNIYTKFGQLIVRKIIKIISAGCHILRLKFTNFDYWRLSVCLFVRFSV